MARTSANPTPEPDHGGAAAPAAGAVQVDDLTLLAGIGPRLATLLAEADILTFADLARAHPAWLQQILEDAGPSFRTHDPSTWNRQAALAAAADWEALRRLQEGLFRGRPR